MEYISAHNAAYVDMVDALLREHVGNDSCQIDWGLMTQRNYAFEISAAKVMQTPEYLVDMGFADLVVYSKDHFLSTMKETYDNGGVRHGHNQTRWDLLSLPHMIDRPVAILTDDDRGQSGTKSDCLTILSYGRDDKGDPVFRKTIIAPNDVFRDITGSERAACILTYLNIQQNEFENNLNRAASGHREILYFDSDLFASIDDALRPKGFDSWQSTSTDNVYKYLSKPSAERVAKLERDGRMIANIAYVELERYAEKIRYVQDNQNIKHEPFRKAIDCIESMDPSLAELMQARGIFIDVCNTVRNPSLREAAMNRMESQFARTYLNVIRDINPDDIATEFVEYWSQDGMIMTEEELEHIWDEVQLMCDSYKIDFYQTKNTNEDILEAQSKNKDFVTKLNDVLADKVFELEEEISEKYQFSYAE